jgi:hypothetical protein
MSCTKRKKQDENWRTQWSQVDSDRMGLQEPYKKLNEEKDYLEDRLSRKYKEIMDLENKIEVLDQESKWYRKLERFQGYIESLISKVNLPQDICRRIVVPYMFEFQLSVYLRQPYADHLFTRIERIEYDPVQKNQIYWTSDECLEREPDHVEIVCQVSSQGSEGYPMLFRWTLEHPLIVWRKKSVFMPWNFDMNKLLNFQF